MRRLSGALLLAVALAAIAPALASAAAVESEDGRTGPRPAEVDRPAPEPGDRSPGDGGRSPETPFDGTDRTDGQELPEARPAQPPDAGPAPTEAPVEGADGPVAPSSAGGSPLLWGAGAVIAVAAAFALGRVTAGSRGSDPAPVAAPAPAPPTTSPVAVRQREELVRSCVEIRDLLGSQALAGRLGAALERAGVVTIDPVGEVFDHRRHRAVHVSDTDDATLDARIARVERVGYADGGEVLRPPEVVVWRHAQREPAT